MPGRSAKCCRERTFDRAYDRSMSSPLSPVGLRLLENQLLNVLKDAEDIEARLNRERVKADLAPLPRQFYLREEFENAIAAAAPKAAEKPKYWWGRLGEDQPPADDGFDPDAAYEKLKASLPPAKTKYSRGFNDGLAIGFMSFDARCLAWNARETARRAKHAASPEGRAEAAWCAMWDRANELLKGKGAVETPPAPAPAAAPVVVATAEAVLRARAIARGEVTPLPTDPAARAVVKAAARRRGEEDKPL